MPPKKAISQDDFLRSKYPKVSETEHVRLKDMWGGTHSLTEEKEFLLGKDEEGSLILEQRNIKYPASLYKCFDEAIVNTIDHFIKQLAGPTQVSYINIIFDKEDGSISFENDGAGIECLKHPDLDCYIPQMIFGKLMTGSNINKDPHSPTGGTNGVGIKIANALSNKFDLRVEWPDVKNKVNVVYEQTWNTLEKCTKPVVSAADLTKSGKVTIKFWPDYKNLYKIDYKTIYNDLDSLFRYRCQLAADYINYCVDIACKTNIYNKAVEEGTCKKSKYICPKITYNGDLIDTAAVITLEQYTNCLSEENSFDCSIVTTTVGPNTKKHPLWYIEVGVISYKGGDSPAEEKTSKSKAAAVKKLPSLKGPICISNINGVAVKSGKPFDYLIKNIVDATAAKVTTILSSNGVMFKKAMVTESLIIRLNAIIPSVGWTGQRKDVANVTPSNLQPYKLQEKDLDNLTGLFQTALINNLKNTVTSIKGLSGGNSIVRVEKYDKARFAGVASKKHLCGLFLPEGDSARTMVRNGISSNKELSYDYFGILTLRGVIINVRKESDVVDEMTHLFDFSSKLQNNKFFNSFKTVTGLDVNSSYDPSSKTYAAEIGRLKYGFIIGCVDQDHAGVGFIFSLIINMFLRFWPHLLKAGYVRRFVTPVRRAIPKDKGSKLLIKEFYSDFEYNDWVKETGENIKKYNISYYKGLAGNSKADVKHMFNNFDKNIMKYITTIDSAKIYEDYFGEDSDPRKEILKIPYEEASREILSEQRKKRTITVDDHAKFEAKAHKLTNIIQKLPNYIDGMNESARKILFGVISILGKRNKEVKVAQLGAQICTITDYLYGEQCLIESIPAKAAYFVGGRQLPPLVAVSDAGMGSRELGGGDAGQCRYLKVKLNTRLVNLIYPPADNELLIYMISDGKKVEPQYYIPTIPMAILESMEIPADGWKIAVWARDVITVIKEVRNQINNYDAKLLQRDIAYLPPDTHGWKGEIRHTSAGFYSCGNYYYDEENQMIKITELPLRVWTTTYKDKLEKKAEKIKDKYGKGSSNQPIGEILNKSPDNGVDIEVYVNPALIAELDECGDSNFDGVEKFFSLYKKMNSNLNMVGENNEVIEFKEYEEIFSQWFDVRRELYQLRIDRQMILLKIEIIIITNKIRYIEETGGENPIIKIKGLTEAEATILLEKNKFQKVNRARFNDHSDVKTADLYDIILNGKKFIRPGSDDLSLKNESLEDEDDDSNDGSNDDNSCNYKYLLSTSDLNRLKKCIMSLTKKLEEKAAELNDLEKKAKKGKFVGAQFWLEELDELEKVIKHGQATNWFYEDFGKENYG